MSLTLNYTGVTTIPVEVEGLTPDAVRTWSRGEVERFEIFHGNTKVPLAEFFDVAGDAADGRLELHGDLAGVHWIGAGMQEGEIHVEGNAGRHVGSEMRSGSIYVAGDAGDWVGAEMHGGLIRVRGRAGHLVGAAYRGSPRGMTAGTILIDGDVGNEIGHSMRRGLLAVGGSCGDMTAFNMIAGSVFVLGDCGIRPGAGMRRGTIGLFGDQPPELLPTFRRATTYRPLFLQLVFQQLKALQFDVDDRLPDMPLDIYHGDFLEGGRGEILLRTSEV